MQRYSEADQIRIEELQEITSSFRKVLMRAITQTKRTGADLQEPEVFKRLSTEARDAQIEIDNISWRNFRSVFSRVKQF